VAISETFDLLEFTTSNTALAERDRFDSIDIVIGDTAALDNERPEPRMAAAPLFIEFGEPARLDPDRIGLIWELPRATGRAIRLRSPLVSLAAHLLPLLLIMLWPNSVESPETIPVQLVFEEPPPPPPQPDPQPPAPQPPQPKMVPGRLASVDMGDVKQKDFSRTTSETPPAAGEPQPQPADTQTATAAPSPPLPTPKPAPPKEKSAFQLPKPAGAPVPHRDTTPHEASRAARVAGPVATQDEYLAYLVTLVRQHMGMLPLSMIGGRRGETMISVVVYDNGMIGPISVMRGSGSPDIDQRIAQMVAAVHKAPPLPQWYQGKAVELIFTMHWPEALEQAQ
jgi:periplasmic protein TonB